MDKRRTLPLLRSMSLVQLVLHVDTSWPLSTILYCSAHFAPSFLLCTTTLSHPTSAATCYPRYLKLSTSSLSFRITCIWPLFPYLQQLITFLLPTFTLNFFLSHSLPNSLTSVLRKVWGRNAQFCVCASLFCTGLYSHALFQNKIKYKFGNTKQSEHRIKVKFVAWRVYVTEQSTALTH